MVAWPLNSIVTRPDGTIRVEWGNCGVTDQALQDFATIRLDQLLAGLPDGKVVECAVGLADNSLSGPEPLAALLRRLRKASVHITSLELQKNRLVDTTTAVLVEHLRESANVGRPLMQLHLTGNALTAAGVQVLIEGAHRCGAYPRVASAPRLPSLGPEDAERRALWLSLEHQQPPLYHTVGLHELLEDRGFPVCFAAMDEKVPPTAVVQLHPAFLQNPSHQPMDTVGGESKGSGAGSSSDGISKLHEFNTASSVGDPQVEVGVKFKTALCRFFETGTCSKGSLCDYAHGVGELRGPNDQLSFALGTSQVKVGGKFMRDRYKTELCRYFDRGTCEKGDLCEFAHGHSELRASGRATGDADRSAQPALISHIAPQDAGTARYKTDLCEFFQRGSCWKGTSCSFAHGQDDMRHAVSASAHPLGPQCKTTMCKYFLEGQCLRGADCTFAHGFDELRARGLGASVAAAPAARVEAKYKTELCRHFMSVGCGKGDGCTFAHGLEDMRDPGGFEGFGGGMPSRASGDAEVHEASAGNYKTELCKFFDRGECQKGEACTYAHGPEDLRRPVGSWRPVEERAAASNVQAQRKRVVCKFWWKEGICRNGADCNFSHDSPPPSFGDREAEAMAWLKEQREKPGEEGEGFERVWKTWCSKHIAKDTAKAERIRTVADFKEMWEATAAASAITRSEGVGVNAGCPSTVGAGIASDIVGVALGAAGAGEEAKGDGGVQPGLVPKGPPGLVPMSVAQPIASGAVGGSAEEGGEQRRRGTAKIPKKPLAADPSDGLVAGAAGGAVAEQDRTSATAWLAGGGGEGQDEEDEMLRLLGKSKDLRLI